MESPSDRFVALGKIVKAHGLGGELQMYPYNPGDAASLNDYGRVFIQDAEGREISYAVLDARIKRSTAVLLRLEGITERVQAAALVGREVFVDKAQLPPLEEGEFYWHELIGLSTITVAGDEVGILSEILSTGAHDVYVIRTGGRELLLPAIEEVIKKVDVERGVMVVDLPPGLAEANAL